MAIRTKKITLVPGDINSLFSAPQILLPAPAAGYTNNILGISHELVFNTIAYATAASLDYYTYGGGTSIVFQDTSIFLAGSNTERPVLRTTSLYSLFSTENDLNLTANVEPTAGNSDLIVKIIYETKLLDV